MKKILVLVLVTFGCNSYQRYNLPIDKKNTKLTTKNIALIGFYPYSYKHEVEGRYTRVTATLDYNQSLKPNFAKGKPIQSFSKVGENSKISYENCVSFVKDYLQTVKVSGKQELESFIDFEMIGSKTIPKCKVKTDNIDFYITGVLGEPFSGPQERPFRLVNELKSALSLLTLFIFPTEKNIEVDSKFYVYDSRLNLLEVSDYKRDMINTTSWWFNLNLDDKENVSEDQHVGRVRSQENIVKEFQFDFLQKYIEKKESL
ncbi:hypothetical protein ND861_15125 [Leptospira sp. 2 VSF19]|uniref:Lipoprotein n=1 Tax=Leptospira soteropolitanensis TaxID=2950025 RepID=A0AAW5VMJ5_9LEPT|nr:hypothetical protein [Leptospira soteropolitanensis]MCW7493819.1 hypothetical protein [Leptospira soteropolitanensis]MCW7501414.1 hypothetical protein [Leptospira soteropolitanensis]MCW7523823.1 hypothetical protein [Leptospira soteropolitanensis]MCW7527688.1 hypothetical protein [Leptospira soteropolitanensis]MCW7531541.1 hypothetical protein [Leptospira soteropolitanensis]